MKRYLMSILLLVGCQSKDILKLGEKLPVEASRVGTTVIQYSVNDHKIAQSIIFGGINYNILQDSSRILTYISTSDKNFVSPENLKIGEKYKDAKAQVISQRFIAGYGFELQTSSGWYAAITNKNLIETHKMDDTAAIFVFYKPSISNQ
jgi:hypothetical protein